MRVVRFTSAVRRAVLAVVAVIWTLPLTGLALRAVQEPDAAATSGWWTLLRETQPSTTNLREVLSGSPSTVSFFDAMIDSLLVAVPATVLLLAVASLAAHALAWGHLPASRAILGTVVALVILPVQVALVPLVAAYDATGLRGTLPGLWLAHVAFGLPLAVLLLRSAMLEVPGDVVDAARADGAGHLDVLRMVVGPLVVPAIVAVAALQFLLVWNDLVVTIALVGGPDAATTPLPVALSHLVGTYPTADSVLAAGALVTLVVPLVVYAALSRLAVSAGHSPRSS